MAVYGVFGVAVGAVVPNQIAAVVGVQIWTLAGVQTVIPLLPEVGRRMPTAAASSLTQLGASWGATNGCLSPCVGLSCPVSPP